MSAGSSGAPNKRSKPKGAVRAKSGCYTCRIRRKKCDESPDETGSCRTCVRLRLQCLGFGAKRPDWMREGDSVKEMREKIKTFLASNGMIKGHSPASLRSSAQSISTSGAITGANTSSGSAANAHHLSSHITSGQDALGLSTPLSASSTLTPDERSAPSSPTPSQTSSHSYTNNQPFPPGSVDTSAHGQYDERMAESPPGVHHDQNSSSAPSVLLLSNGRPLPSRSHTYAAHSRRSNYHNNYAGANSGHGLGLIDDSLNPISTSGNRFGDNTRYGTPPTSMPFPRPNFTTSWSSTVPAQTHFSNTSNSSRFSSGTSLPPSSYSGAIPSYYPTTSTVNSISNAFDVASPTLGSTSSTCSSPPMRSNNTPFTPCTPLPGLPPLPPSDDKTYVDMDWTATVSSLTDLAPPGSNLFSPRLDSGSFTSLDMNVRWASDYHTAPSGPNVNTANNSSHVLVKTERDIASLDMTNYTADDSNAYVHRANTSSRPRSSTDDGCTTPTPTTTNNFPPDSTNVNSTVHSSVYNYNNNNATTDYAYNYSYHASSTNPGAFHGFHHLSTPMATTNVTTFPVHGIADSPYRTEPELSPDSPTPSHRTDPMIGAYGPAQSPYVEGQGHDAGTFVSVAHHPPGQFALHSAHGQHTGAGHGGLASAGQNVYRGYGPTHGYGHAQSSSSWAGMEQQQHQDSLLQQQSQGTNQEQGQVQGPCASFHGNYSNDSRTLQFPNASPTVRRTDLLPPSMQSSFSPLYHEPFVLDELGMNNMVAFDGQQAPINTTALTSIGDGALIHYYPQTLAQASISEADFFGLPREQQEQVYQECAISRLIQPALADPLYNDRGDRSLVEHYLMHVRPVQYFFLDDRVVDLLCGIAFSNEAVRNAICSVASVHKRRMREGSIQLRGGSPSNSPNRAPLAIAASAPDVPEGDDGNTYYNRIQAVLRRTYPERLTGAEAMAGLQCISSFLFAGGVGGWDFFLDVACQWVGSVFTQLRNTAGDAFLLDALTQMKRDAELNSFVVRTTMWFEVLASVTMVRAPKFLDVYRALFSVTDDQARIVEIDGKAAHSNTAFSMLEVMGCDNQTFLALAEISALAAWKDEQIKNLSLSNVELVERGNDIERRCLRETGVRRYQDGLVPKADSLENRRRLTADIFNASARLYLHTVLSGDKPSVKEIRRGVSETIAALRRVPAEPKPLRRSVVRSVVFPICLAGCMTDDNEERTTVKQFLEGEGGAGNCASVVAVMEEVWERRDAKRKRGRGGVRSGAAGDVNWREVLHEHGGKVPILLV